MSLTVRPPYGNVGTQLSLVNESAMRVSYGRNPLLPSRAVWPAGSEAMNNDSGSKRLWEGFRKDLTNYRGK